MSTQSPETLQDVFTDPDLFFWQLVESKAYFVKMSRQNFHQSIFSDNRISAAAEQSIPTDIDALLAAFQQLPYTAPRLSYIFHVAHCGSTLLARALDMPERNLVYREPFVLRQLGILAIQNNWSGTAPERFQNLLKLTIRMLDKRYIKDAPIIVKANLPVNYLR